jgi:signal transduction histidine kinase
MPLKTKEAVIGVLNIESEHVDAFDESDVTVLESLASQAAVAIENARLYEQAQQLAVVEERHRLARDLHDSVTQSLYGMALYSEAASGHLTYGNLERVEEHLGELQATAQEALTEMRLLIYELRPPVLQEEGIAAALRARLQSVEERAGLETDLHVELANGLPTQVEDGLYRIAQEALNNALKHAQAHSITVRLVQADHKVTLEVHDDGIGFDLPSAGNQGGVGLSVMQERASELGAGLTIDSEPGAGTRVFVEVYA